MGGKRHEVIILEGDENALFQFKRKDAYKTTVRKKVLLTEKGIANFSVKHLHTLIILCLLNRGQTLFCEWSTKIA